MIEIRHLKLVQAVAELGSLSKAAEKLHLTQSALSHQLKELEASLGTPIFYRINNQLHFTPAGKEFRDAGKGILEQITSMENRIRELEHDKLKNYIHGYSQEEMQRLNDQATTISELLHWDSQWKAGSVILEAACGIGSQTQIIAQMNPKSSFMAIDLSEKSLAQAVETIDQLGITNVEFRHADVFELPFENEHFDHVFVCFLLEHVSKPLDALIELKRVLKPQGTITVIEGDHGSAYFYPESEMAQKAIDAQVVLQKRNGGNANIGRQLYPMLKTAGFVEIVVNPRQVYVDESRPELVDRFIKNTFTAMIKGVADEVVAKSIIAENEMQQGINDLYKTAEGGTFSYTFFKTVATKP